MIGALDDDLVGPHAVHAVVEALAGGSRSPSICSAGNLLGRPARPSRARRRPNWGRGRPGSPRGLLFVSRAEADRRLPAVAWPRPRSPTDGGPRSVADDDPASDDRVLAQLRHGLSRGSRRVLSRGRPGEERRQRLPWRPALEEDGAHGLADGHADPGASGQDQRRADSGNALRHHAREGLGLREGTAARQSHAERAVARQAPVHVSTRSPRPLRPAKVAGVAPRATPRRVISASPRVTNAARASSPRPSPSPSPVASAIAFFMAPPISTPATSRLV